jgi:hypothetical protein
MSYLYPLANGTGIGVVNAGTNITIVDGVVSSSGGGSSGVINVTLTSTNYTATANDYYIGATNNNITITFPLGTVGKVYVVKNQSEGVITVKGTGQNLDQSGDKNLGAEESLVAVFAGTRWNIIK